MTSNKQPSNRCGYSPDIAFIHESIPESVCYRPVWGDRDRCVWHAKESGKSTKDLEELKPEPGEHIDGAYLEEAMLSNVSWFNNISLVNADFTGADLRAADFSNSDLKLAKLEKTTAIYTDFSDGDLEGALISETDLRSANLVDTKLNGAIFSNVFVNRDTNFGEYSIYEKEEEIAPRTLYETHQLEAAAWVYRELQQIYHDNSLPRLTRHSYQQEKDVRRRLAWDEGEYGHALKYELSRWGMLYGTSPYRILAISATFILVCGLLYPLIGGVQTVSGERTITYSFEHLQTAPLWWIGEVLFHSIYFSVITFSTLGYGNLQPVGSWAQLLSGIEAILGSLFAALLVFVLARSATW